MAQPVCEADRHVKKELKKKSRGISDLERQAENSPSKEAQVVADNCLAIRTVMRDEEKYPREPPGVQRYQQLQLIAASVERVMAAHPSALLKGLSRLLSVLNVFRKQFEQLEILFNWIHQSAHLLKVPTSGEEAQSHLLTFVHEPYVSTEWSLMYSGRVLLDLTAPQPPPAAVEVPASSDASRGYAPTWPRGGP